MWLNIVLLCLYKCYTLKHITILAEFKIQTSSVSLLKASLASLTPSWGLFFPWFSLLMELTSKRQFTIIGPEDPLSHFCVGTFSSMGACQRPRLWVLHLQVTFPNLLVDTHVRERKGNGCWVGVFSLLCVLNLHKEKEITFKQNSDTPTQNVGVGAKPKSKSLEWIFSLIWAVIPNNNPKYCM